MSATARPDFKRRRALAAAAAGVVAVLVVLLVVLLLSGSDQTKPPATDAAKLVPANALVYVHLSVDRDRSSVRDAQSIAARFPSLVRLRDSLFARLRTGGARAGVDYARDVQPWIGKEIALALLSTNGTTAGSLILVDVRDRPRAEGFLLRAAGRPSATLYRGVALRQYGGVFAAFLKNFLVIGQDTSVKAAIDIATGHASSLARNEVYTKAVAGEPDGRVLDAYASVEGVRRLLEPQTGLLGAAGTLLDQRGLAATALALSAGGHRAQLHVHSVLDPRTHGPATFRAFAPSLLDDVPAGALAVIAVQGLDRAVPRLLATGAAGGAGRALAALLARAKTELQRSGVDVQRDILPVLQGESVLALSPHTPAPVLTLIAKTPDPKRAAAAFAALQAPLARIFAPRGAGPGVAPTFTDKRVDGVTVHQLSLTPGLELDYATFDGKLVASTNLDGIRAVRRSAGRLRDSDAFRSTLGNLPSRVTSVLFLDFSQLVGVAQQAGLTSDSRFRTALADLRRIRALGAVSTSGDASSTADLTLDIP